MGNPLEWIGGAILFIGVAVVNAIVNPIGMLMLGGLVIYYVVKIRNRKCSCEKETHD